LSPAYGASAAATVCGASPPLAWTSIMLRLWRPL
jgi:hypothetical protein